MSYYPTVIADLKASAIIIHLTNEFVDNIERSNHLLAEKYFHLLLFLM